MSYKFWRNAAVFMGIIGSLGFFNLIFAAADGSDMAAEPKQSLSVTRQNNDQRSDLSPG